MDILEAYDHVGRAALIEVLHLMPLPSCLRGSISLSLHNRSFFIYLNGSPTGLFQPRRSVTQGSVLAPLLSNKAFIPLAGRLGATPHIYSIIYVQITVRSVHQNLHLHEGSLQQGMDYKNSWCS